MDASSPLPSPPPPPRQKKIMYLYNCNLKNCTKNLKKYFKYLKCYFKFIYVKRKNKEIALDYFHQNSFYSKVNDNIKTISYLMLK